MPENMKYLPEAAGQLWFVILLVVVVIGAGVWLSRHESEDEQEAHDREHAEDCKEVLYLRRGHMATRLREYIETHEAAYGELYFWSMSRTPTDAVDDFDRWNMEGQFKN